MSDLADRECVPCRGDTPPLPTAETDRLLGEVPGWRIERAYHLTKEFTFPNFQTALDFTNAVGAIAEDQNHHPDIHLAWGKVGVEIWTHKIKGLTESDFVFAAKINALPGPA